MLPPTTIVFDLDGTLIDSRGDIVAAVNHTLRETGRTPLPGPVIVRYVGDGSRSLLARVTRLAESSDELDSLLAIFLDYYVAHPVDFTRWAAGAQETLEILGGDAELSLAICTNKPRRATDAILDALGVRDRFRAVAAGGDTAEKKPSGAPLLHIAQQLGVEPGAMVMVGDGPQDVESARRAGVRSVVVESAFGQAERAINARPDAILRSLTDLPDAIARWRTATVRISSTPPGRAK